MSKLPVRPLHDLGVICEPDSREPWFVCEAHGLEESCLTDTLTAVGTAVDLTLEALERPVPVRDAVGG